MNFGLAVPLAIAASCAAVLTGACVQSVPRFEAAPTLVPTPEATATIAPIATSEPAATPVPTSSSVAVPTGTLASAPSPAPTVTPLPEAATPTATTVVTRFGLFLELEGISEESVVRGNSVIARGKTTPDAIISINGVVIPIDANGDFEVVLALDPGPNIIEVVASDLEGNELNKVFAVVSLPEGVQP